MGKAFLILIAVLLQVQALAQADLNFPVFELPTEERSIELTAKVHYLVVSPDSARLIELTKDKFAPLTTENLDFTNKGFYLGFQLKGVPGRRYILETARPVTNKVWLINQLGDTLFSGDDYAFENQNIPMPSRKRIFSIEVTSAAPQQYLLYLESDGEMLGAPIIIWNRTDYYAREADENYMLGMYYGALIFIFIIYLFFFIVLKENSFLYYILYVISIGLLQFSLDGLTFKYLLPGGGYLTNHILLVSACLTLIFLMQYACSFLKLKENMPKFERIYKVVIIISIAITFLSLIPGITYELTFPIINLFSLLATIFIPITILIASRRGIKVSFWFTWAFIFLIAGAVLFILRNLSVLDNNWFTDHSLKIFSAIEVILLSISMANRYRELQQEKAAAQAETLLQLEEKNQLMDDINVRLETQVKERTSEIEQQRHKLSEKNRDIMASIQYAKRIQDSIIPTEDHIRKLLPNSFVYFQPRDVVSGDFYWIRQVTTTKEEKFTVFTAADCTGHGVPGAFVSMMGVNYLDRSTKEESVNTPAEALNYLNEGINNTLNTNEDLIAVRDGMDMVMCAFNHTTKRLMFAGAKNSIYIIRKAKGEVPNEIEGARVYSDEKALPYYLIEYQGDKQPIGLSVHGRIEPFTDKTIQMESGDSLYLFSDGYPDQFGGPRGKKFMNRQFKDLLLSVQEKSMMEQKTILKDTLDAWMDEYGSRQIDDILVFGIKID